MLLKLIQLPLLINSEQKPSHSRECSSLGLHLHFSKRERAHTLKVQNNFEFPVPVHFPVHTPALPWSSSSQVGDPGAGQHPWPSQGLCLNCPSGAEFPQETAQDTRNLWQGRHSPRAELGCAARIQTQPLMAGIISEDLREAPEWWEQPR